MQQIVATLDERTKNTIDSLNDVQIAQRELSRELDFRREIEKQVALIQQWIDDEKKEREESGRRLWAFGPNIVSALISGLISAAVAYFVSRH